MKSNNAWCLNQINDLFDSIQVNTLNIENLKI